MESLSHFSASNSWFPLKSQLRPFLITWPEQNLFLHAAIFLSSQMCYVVTKCFVSQIQIVTFLWDFLFSFILHVFLCIPKFLVRREVMLSNES